MRVLIVVVILLLSLASVHASGVDDDYYFNSDYDSWWVHERIQGIDNFTCISVNNDDSCTRYPIDPEQYKWHADLPWKPQCIKMTKGEFQGSHVRIGPDCNVMNFDEKLFYEY
jgi:hypothetical protein